MKGNFNSRDPDRKLNSGICGYVAFIKANTHNPVLRNVDYRTNGAT